MVLIYIPVVVFSLKLDLFNIGVPTIEELVLLILDKYMSNLDVVNLRMATDLFIHAQNSDANAGTIAEYLLCQKKIINPVWITYPHYETYGSPFYLFSDFEELPEVIISAIQDSSLRVSPLLKESIRRCGWGEQSKEWVALYYNV